MVRLLTYALALSLIFLGCASPNEDAVPPTVDVPPTGGGFTAWDGSEIPTPDVVLDATVLPEVIEDVGPDVSDTMDASPLDVSPDGGDTIEDVEVAPPPCQSDDDCAENTASNPCKRPACNPASGLCIEVDRPVGTPCETPNLCQSGQVCQSGQCTGGNSLNCADEDPCTTDICDPAQGCIFQPVDDCCIPNCEDKNCGSDGCVGTCGFCDTEWSCTPEGTCINCVPNCIGLTCGANGCGGVCGVCPEDWFCIDPGICMACLPDWVRPTL